ncbi:MAG: carbon-nitrogen hydrolase family protein [Nitrososphaerota archaeon]|nr:carbon-nitrogen hydrolase family protein [Candidatus Calditenuis fumarioli]
MVRVAIVQVPVEGDPMRNVEWVSRTLSSLGTRADLVVLPEAWIHHAPILDIAGAVQASERALAVLRELAASLGSTIVGGALYLRFRDGYAATVPVISPSGEIVGFQEKVHPFREERNFLKAGDAFKVFSAGGVRFGVMVCHDVVYPESARTLVLKGAELLLNPSRIRREGVEPWHVYLRARALENRVQVIGCNVVLGRAFNGRSIAVDLELDEFRVARTSEVEAGEEPGTLTVELDPKRLEQERRERLSNRNVGAYVL